MDRIEINGNSNDVIVELLNYMNKNDAIKFLKEIHNYTYLFNQGESFKKEKINENDDYGWFSSGWNYYINIKKTTMLIIGLILDILFTKGFTSLFLNFNGIDIIPLQKLKSYEKCILKEIVLSKGKLSSPDDFLDKDRICVNNDITQCCYRKYNSECALNKETLNFNIDSLISKKILRKEEKRYIIEF